jgi:integrase/recombinase XerD
MKQSFEIWLIERFYSEKCILDFLMRVRVFEQWLKENRLTTKRATYNDLLRYIEKLQKDEKPKGSINKTLQTIEHYYNYLQGLSSGVEIDNIALNVRLRGVRQEEILLLTEEELNLIYENYQSESKHGYFKYSNKLILGLIIYQGLDKRDLINIELTDINLEKGTIYAPAGVRRKNSRILQLESHQIIQLHKYIENHRGIGRNGKQSEEESEKLLHPNASKEGRFHDQLKLLAKRIKSQNDPIPFKRLTQLRQSRIGIWIDRYGLRKAQYLSGYKRVGNIEKYRHKDMRDLLEQIEMFHPMN